MSTDLQQRLAALHEALANTDSVDAQSRELLMALLSDITRLLGRSPVAPEERSLRERLEELAVQFEAEHPAVSVSVRNLLDALAKAGI